MDVWIKELLKNLDEYVDEPTRRKVMAGCGEKCPFTHLSDDRLRAIKDASKTEADFLDHMTREWYLRRENDQYYVIFDRCYCPLVNQDISGTSTTICYCTLGNVKRKFAIGLGRDIDVTMHNTILAGDQECRFHIQL